MLPLLPESPEATLEIIPVLIGDTLLSHFLDQRFEVAQGGDGASGVAVEPGDVLAGAAEKLMWIDSSRVGAKRRWRLIIISEVAGLSQST